MYSHLCAKLFGFLACGLGILVLLNLFLRHHAFSLDVIAEAAGSPYFAALLLSVIVSFLSIFAGLRALFSNQLALRAKHDVM